MNSQDNCAERLEPEDVTVTAVDSIGAGIIIQLAKHPSSQYQARNNIRAFNTSIIRCKGCELRLTYKTSLWQ
jgi:hypothetical protein